ncbi:MAG TPA: C69 family dipeptidase [Blastocatellia bacterium]|nr:C69 family dipeptidase [Blastocatellia bacterium]
MCDTLVAVPPATRDSSVWFGKNSDREPGEAQIVEQIPAARFQPGSKVRCTHIEINQTARTNEVLLSRPFWMWGAEMGTNEYGVVIGNEAVFTKIPYEKVGLTGMDLLRLALERATEAREALDIITQLIEEIGQGGACGYRNRSFRYHNSFVIADPGSAWILETAGPFWAARRVTGVDSISNELCLEADFDLISSKAYPFARSQGWCTSASDFGFARAFSDLRYSKLSGAKARRACTFIGLQSAEGRLGREHFFDLLRDHAGANPGDGWRMRMPCAHASWWPARQQGQTTGSMVSRLSHGDFRHWLTGTSSPCLSVFKPAGLGGEPLRTGPRPGAGYDSGSLFWKHEMLHRLVLPRYARNKAIFEGDRTRLEQKWLSTDEESAGKKDFSAPWEEHLRALDDWIERLRQEGMTTGLPTLASLYWRKQQRLDGISRGGKIPIPATGAAGR